MNINGTEKLACRTSIRKEFERHGRISIDPLPNLPIIKDLVVDMSPFWDKIRAVTPWLTAVTYPSKRYGSSGQLRLLPDTYQFHNVDACIMCGACGAAGRRQAGETDGPPREPWNMGLHPLQHVRPSLPQGCPTDGGDYPIAPLRTPAWLDLNRRGHTGMAAILSQEWFSVCRSPLDRGQEKPVATAQGKQLLFSAGAKTLFADDLPAVAFK